MPDSEIYIELSDWIAAGSLILVDDALSKNDDLDITYSDGQNYDFGMLFVRSVLCDTQRGNVALTKRLIDYFENTQLPNLARLNTSEYDRTNVIYRFKASLELAIAGEVLSDEMVSLLSPYIHSNRAEHNSLLSMHDSQSYAAQNIQECHSAHSSDISNSMKEKTIKDRGDSDISMSSVGSTTYHVPTNALYSTISSNRTTVADIEHTEEFLHLSIRNKAEKLRILGDKCRRESNNFKDAEECYRESIDFDPSYYCSYRQLGKLCQKDGRYIEAIDHYVKAIIYKTRYDTQYRDVYKALSEIVQDHISDIELRSKVDELRSIIDQKHDQEELLAIFADVPHMPDIYWPSLPLAGEYCGDASDI